MHSYISLPIFIFFIGFIVYWNFPILILFTNLRPLYYEDLFIDTSKIPLIRIDPKIKQRFEVFFEWSLIFSNSLFSAAIAEYWLYKAYSKESYIEIIGVTGGILKIFQLINHMNGNIILHITKTFIDKEIKKNKTMELTQVNGICHKIIKPKTLKQQKKQKVTKKINQKDSSTASKETHVNAINIKINTPNSIII